MFTWMGIKTCKVWFFWSHHSFFTRFQGVTLKETDNNHLHDEDGVAHPNAVTGALTKWHVDIRVDLCLVAFTESVQSDTQNKVAYTHYKFEINPYILGSLLKEFVLLVQNLI